MLECVKIASNSINISAHKVACIIISKTGKVLSHTQGNTAISSKLIGASNNLMIDIHIRRPWNN